MAGIRRFEDIQAWQEARELTRMVYAVSTRGAFARDYRLRDQIQGSAISVMSNIAEGFDARTDAEFIRFLGYARRSATELQSQLYTALDQKYNAGGIRSHLRPSDEDKELYRRIHPLPGEKAQSPTSDIGLRTSDAGRRT